MNVKVLPRLLFAFDPGVNDAGIACFVDGALYKAASIKGKRGTDQYDRALQGAERAHAFMLAVGTRHVVKTSCALVEFPKVYPNGRTVNPDDLLILAGMATAVAFAASKYMETVSRVFPRDWKGTLDADLMTKVIRKRLTPAELGVLGKLSKNHNVVDAVGIALHHLGRLK